MCEGKWPDKDHKGTRYARSSAEGQLAGSNLAGGFFTALWNVKGDLKFFHDGLGMKCVTGVDPCDYCDCHRITHGGDPDMHQLNFKRGAGWKRSLVSPRQWRDRFPNRHLLFLKLAWLSQHNCAADELHICYLGVYQVLLGSVLWLLCYRVMIGSPSDNIDVVWCMIKEFYSTHHVTSQYTSFSLGSFTQADKPRSDFPRLKGRGHEVKSVLLPLASIWQQCSDKSDAAQNMVQEMLDIMVEIQNLFDEYASECFLPKESADRILVLADCFLERYAAMHNSAMANGDLLFHTLPKHHAWWHLCHRCQYEHPRLGNCCLDEDFVGRIKEIVQGSSAGAALHNIPNKVLAKFLWGKTMLYCFPNDL